VGFFSAGNRANCDVDGRFKKQVLQGMGIIKWLAAIHGRDKACLLPTKENSGNR